MTKTRPKNRNTATTGGYSPVDVEQVLFELARRHSVACACSKKYTSLAEFVRDKQRDNNGGGVAL